MTTEHKAMALRAAARALAGAERRRIAAATALSPGERTCALGGVAAAESALETLLAHAHREPAAADALIDAAAEALVRGDSAESRRRGMEEAISACGAPALFDR